MKFLISYTEEQLKERMQEISTLEELLALFHAEDARQPDDFRGLILKSIEGQEEHPAPVLKRLPREEWPQFELEVYDGWRD